MRSVLFVMRFRAAALFGVCTLALTQAACAHPVMVEPAVVVQARVGTPVYGSVYGPAYGSYYAPPPVVVSPQPMWIAPPPVVVSPRPWMPPVYHHHHHGWHGQGVNHGWGHRAW